MYFVKNKNKHIECNLWKSRVFNPGEKKRQKGKKTSVVQRGSKKGRCLKNSLQNGFGIMKIQLIGYTSGRILPNTNFPEVHTSRYRILIIIIL